MHLPVIIGGGGIIGLLFYYELQKRFPDLDCVLFEGSSYFGDLATGRNSGVFHAGLYYPTGSLKHLLCLKGNKMWDELSRELGFEVNRCGKYLVATSDEEKESLRSLYQQAIQNDVSGLRETSQDEKEELEKWCFHHDSFFSESTAVVSPSDIISKLVHHIERKNGMLMREHKILKVEKDKVFSVHTDKGTFTCDFFINACGGFAPQLRKGLGLTEIESFWVKGHYLKLNKKFYNSSLIYPVPPKDLAGLGVHTSFDLDGIIRFGPDTLEVEEYLHGMNDNAFENMVTAILKVFKGISKEDLSLDYCGIRSKIKKNGKLYTDFLIGDSSYHNIEGYLEYLGIESPGLTSAPALVEEGLKRLKVRS